VADFKPIYREYLETVKSDIVVQMKQQKRYATGNSINSLRVVANQFLSAEIRGDRSISTLEDGVGNQPRAVGNNLISGLMAWMKAKGIHPFRRGEVLPNTDKNIRRAATGIAINMVQRGSAIKRGEKGLDIKTAIDENMPELLKGMGKIMVDDFTNEFKIKGK